jgi:hypothetical protein
MFEVLNLAASIVDNAAPRVDGLIVASERAGCAKLSRTCKKPYGRRSAHTAGPASAPSRTDYTITNGKVSLAVYRKRVDAPAPGRSPRPVLFLVHGSSNSALSSFDLTVPVPANL